MTVGVRVAASRGNYFIEIPKDEPGCCDPCPVFHRLAMSAKLTIIFFILICFEIGFLLIVLPWLSDPYPYWSENYILVWLVETLQWPALGRFLTSGYVRGAVTGIGVLNVVLGIREIINFKQTVRSIQAEWQGNEVDSK